MGVMSTESSIGSSEPGKMPQVWRVPMVNFAVIITAMLIAYWNTITNMVAVWWGSDTFAHGFIIFPISLYLIWQRRDAIMAITPLPAHRAWLLIVVLNFGWLLAHLVDIQVAKQFMLVAMIPSIIWALWGTLVVRVMLFPLCYLFFAVPFGEFLIPYLQDITAVFTVELLRLTGIPVYLEGRFLAIPTGVFEVAEACSGLRYLIASVTLGVLYAYITYRFLYKRLLFIGMAILVPIIANGIRAYGIVMIAHLSDYKLAMGIDHLIYGWLFFGLVIFLLVWGGSFFRDDRNATETVAASNVGSDRQLDSFATTNKWTLLCLVFVISGPVAAKWLERPYDTSLTEPALPQLGNDWLGPYETINLWSPEFINPTSAQLQQYEKNGQIVQVYIAFYADQKQGAELISSENRLYDQEQWRRINDKLKAVQLGNRDDPANVHEVVIQSRQDKVLLWHWSQIGSVSVVNPLKAKLTEARSRLFREQAGSAAIIVSTRITLDNDEAEQRLNEFLEEFYPRIVALMAINN